MNVPFPLYLCYYFFFAGTIFLFEAHCTDVIIFLVEAFIYLLAIMLY